MTAASGQSELANSCHLLGTQSEGRDGGHGMNGQQGEGQGWNWAAFPLWLTRHCPVPGPGLHPWAHQGGHRGRLPQAGPGMGTQPAALGPAPPPGVA